MTQPTFLLRSARSEEAPAIAEIHVNTWNTTYGDLFPRELLASFTVKNREQTWSRLLADEEARALIFVAEMDGQVVGFVQAAPSRTTEPRHVGGEIVALYVLQSFQGHGLGRALFERGAHALREKGLTDLLVWVAEGNPACAFYEHLGGVQVARKCEEVPGGSIREIAYRWESGVD